MSPGRLTDLDEVKRIPIGEVAKRLGIQVRGRSARCPYPQHKDRNPSFQLYPGENRCWCTVAAREAPSWTWWRSLEASAPATRSDG